MMVEIRKPTESACADFFALLVPTHVTGEDHLSFMEDCKYAIGISHGLVDYPVWGTCDLPKARVGRGWIGETFRRHYRPHVWIGVQWSYGFPYLDSPALGILSGKLVRNRTQNTA